MSHFPPICCKRPQKGFQKSSFKTARKAREDFSVTRTNITSIPRGRPDGWTHPLTPDSGFFRGQPLAWTATLQWRHWPSKVVYCVCEEDQRGLKVVWMVKKRKANPRVPGLRAHSELQKEPPLDGWGPPPPYPFYGQPLDQVWIRLAIKSVHTN